MLIVTDAGGALRAADFGDYEQRMRTLLGRHYGSFALHDGTAPATITRALDVYFAGDLAAIVPIASVTGGTSFQREVWLALRSIPAGSRTTYGALAAQLGRPSASRAIGLANGANPVAIIVPCHRVVGANGTLTGYGGGLERKQWLLDHEHRHARR